MNIQDPFRIHQIDLNNIVYTKIKINEPKKIIFIKYNDSNNNKPFVIQLPTILNLQNPIKINEEYHELEVPLITQRKEKLPSLIDFFEKLDNKIIQDTKINSKNWLNPIPRTTENLINSIKYKRLIKESDIYADGVIKIKIIKSSDFETLLTLENNERINIKNIPVNSWCKMLIEIYAIVINIQTNTISLFIRPIIISFKLKEVHNYNYKLLNDSDSEKEDIEIPDTEINNIFIKNDNDNDNKIDINQTSSQINVNNNNKILTTSEYSSTSSTSSNDNQIVEKNKNKLSESSDENIDELMKEIANQSEKNNTI